jgi:predicted alpha/beta hydrolase family esterase
MKHTILIVPGLGDSGETHWQNYWLQHFETSQKFRRLGQSSFKRLVRSLNSSIESAEGEIIIVAHMPAH